MTYWNQHMSTGGWVLSAIGMVILLAVVLGSLAWLLSQRRPTGRGLALLDATQTLQQRLARGELTVDQYEVVLRALNRTPTPGTEPSTRTPPQAKTA